MLTVQDDFTASRENVTRHRRDGGVFALVGIGHIARVVDQFRRAAAWAFHGHSSLKETINTSSMTVSFRCTKLMRPIERAGSGPDLTGLYQGFADWELAAWNVFPSINVT
jgi:hypothetical protein